VQLWPKPRPLLVACLAVSAALSTLLGDRVPRLLGEQASLGVRLALAMPLAAAFVYFNGARREMRSAGGECPSQRPTDSLPALCTVPHAAKHALQLPLATPRFICMLQAAHSSTFQCASSSPQDPSSTRATHFM
jgi:hypothetical protein